MWTWCTLGTSWQFWSGWPHVPAGGDRYGSSYAADVSTGAWWVHLPYHDWRSPASASNPRQTFECRHKAWFTLLLILDKTQPLFRHSHRTHFCVPLRCFSIVFLCKHEVNGHVWLLCPCLTYCVMTFKGIVHFEIKIWYLSAYPKGIQDVGVFFSSVDQILMFLGQTVLVCQSYNGRYRSLSL